MTDKSGSDAIDIDALVERCQSGEADAQIEAMRVLREAGATSAAPALLPLLASDQDLFVRDAALRSLAALGMDHLDEIGPEIEALVTDAEDMIRDQAVEALGLLRYAPARKALERVLAGDEDWVVRASAAEALGYLGDARALAALEAALDDEVDPVRSYVATSIGQLGDAAQLPVIRRRLSVETHPQPRASLLEVALRMGDESAFDDLLALARSIHVRDDEFMYHVLRVADQLVSRDTPAVVARRATELDQRIAELQTYTTHFKGWTTALRARLAALACG